MAIKRIFGIIKKTFSFILNQSLFLVISDSTKNYNGISNDLLTSSQ